MTLSIFNSWETKLQSWEVEGKNNQQFTFSKTFYEGNAQDEVGNVDYTNKQSSLEENMNINTEKLNVGWYRNTHGQVPSESIKHYLLSKEYGGLSGQNPWAGDGSLGDSTQVTSPSYEQKQYYYHPDHLGSSNYLTDVLGETYQHSLCRNIFCAFAQGLARSKKGLQNN